MSQFNVQIPMPDTSAESLDRATRQATYALGEEIAAKLLDGKRYAVKLKTWHEGRLAQYGTPPLFYANLHISEVQPYENLRMPDYSMLPTRQLASSAWEELKSRLRYKVRSLFRRNR